MVIACFFYTLLIFGDGLLISIILQWVFIVENINILSVSHFTFFPVVFCLFKNVFLIFRSSYVCAYLCASLLTQMYTHVYLRYLDLSVFFIMIFPSLCAHNLPPRIMYKSTQIFFQKMVGQFHFLYSNVKFMWSLCCLWHESGI